MLVPTRTKGFALSVIGSREKNQDAFLIDDERGLYAVADGVGGGLQGEVASRMAIEGLKLYATPTGSLKPTVTRLQEDILREAMETLGEALMGTTLTALRIADGVVSLSHVGDSRCYLYSDGVLRLMTEDHESFDESMQVPVLSSYLGIPSDFHALTIQEEIFPIKSGDRILLCSDGLYRQMEEMKIAAVLKQFLSTPEAALQELCKQAGRAEYSDNITVVFVEIS